MQDADFLFQPFEQAHLGVVAARASRLWGDSNSTRISTKRLLCRSVAWLKVWTTRYSRRTGPQSSRGEEVPFAMQTIRHASVSSTTVCPIARRRRSVKKGAVNRPDPRA